MLMIGCDFHPGLEEVAILDTESGQRRELTLSHAFGLEPVRQFYAALPHPVRVGLEASDYSGWYEEMLEELGIELWVGDPARIRKAAPRRQKTNRNDALLALQLLEENRFPRIWVPDRATRDLRQLLMYRHKLVTMRGAIGNQLQAIAMNRGMQKKGQLWSQQGREQLEVAGIAALDHAAARRTAPPARAVGRGDHRARPGSLARGRSQSRCPLADAPSARRRPHHRADRGAHAGASGAVRLGPQGGQLRRSSPGRVLHRSQTKARSPQQGGQSFPALGAGGVGHRGRAPLARR